MSQRLLTPSKITAWLECGHFLSLRNQLDAGTISLEATPRGSLAELLIEKGTTHELNCLQDLQDQGLEVFQVPGRNPDESFEEWVARIANPMDRGYDVIYQMPFAHDGIRGIADFLVRVDDHADGYSRYEPIDAKLARAEGKPGHVLQLCFYADAIMALTNAAPQRIHLWLGTGDQESLLVEQFAPYWRRLQRQLRDLLNEEESGPTSPAPCDHCDYCEFKPRCEEQWRREDSLVYVANIRAPERAALEGAQVRTISHLAELHEPVEQIHEENLRRLTKQAALQVVSRKEPAAPPKFELLSATDDPVYGHGFSLMPRPDTGDIFFDFEGHPFWTPQCDLFFLSGLYLTNTDGRWTYDDRWAHDLAEQERMISELVEFFADRRRRYPGMHVYHYNHTERTSLERLTRGTETEGLLTSLVDSGLFVDLFVVAKNALQVGTESYGLKYLERLTGYERSGGIEQGAGAVVEYEEYMKSKDPEILSEIAAYNRDDVIATKELRDWLLAQRPADLAWREATLEVEDRGFDTDEIVEQLKQYQHDRPEHLLGDLLNYWRRERAANVTPKFAKASSDFASLYSDRDYIANLSLVGFEEVAGRSGEVVKNVILRWPPQVVDSAFRTKKNVLFTGVGVEHGYGYIPSIDFEGRELRMRWRDRHEELGVVPSVMTLDDYVSPNEKPGVLFHLAEQVLHPHATDRPSRVSLSLLAGEPPRFETGWGPRNGVFSDDLDETLAWIGHLDESYIAIQGPPGTGKTYSGSHIIYELIKSGKRVGITAMSHSVIDNLFEATYEVFASKGELSLLKALRRDSKPATGALEGVRYEKSGSGPESDNYNLIGATTWLWSRSSMRPYPVDYLVIDEAGQLSLADAIASANSARNLILLGDPLQLSQVSQAEHPGGSGASVLQHVLGEHATIPSTQGIFISETRRMHPDVCTFISGQIYEHRLTSHESCSQQGTEFGTGLRWLRASHESCSTESPEEAELVAAQISEMVNTSWVNQRGDVAALSAEDFMVVAPYNDQVRLLRQKFETTPGLRAVQVGTVDKFQGREAPVVFFTMTTSSGADMPRGPEFLFSRNRLNVAVSRARCLAYLVCTEELLNSRARTIEEMRLIGTLSAFVESAVVV
ncbi:MAG: TM0106 family RecB-like putative nuclease [Acidimicrobiales bacterium]